MKKVKLNHILTLAALMAIATACKKDPTPESNPNHPTDTVSPLKRNDTLFVNLTTSHSFGPSPDTVRAHLNKPGVERVIIHLFRENGIGHPINCSHYSPGVFHKAREELQQDIDVDSTRVTLFIIFEVRNVNAPNHDWDQEQLGITSYDKAWFESKGAKFILLNKSKFGTYKQY